MGRVSGINSIRWTVVLISPSVPSQIFEYFSTSDGIFPAAGPTRGSGRVPPRPAVAAQSCVAAS